MRVLHLIDSLAPGGAERSMLALAPHLGSAGVDLEIGYLGPADGLRGDFESVGVPCHSLDGPGGRVGALTRSRGLVVERRPDLVHTTLFEADVAGRLAAWSAGVPVASSLVNATYGPAHRADPAVRRHRLAAAQALDAATARLTVRLHAVSGAVADVMSRALHYPRDRIDVIPRGRDPGRLRPAETAERCGARRRLGLRSGAPVVLALGRLDFQKGFDVLLCAVGVLGDPDLQVVLAGRPGGHSDALRTQAEALGIRTQVQFVGHHDDIATLLAAADLLVAPTRREGFPGVVLEAMASGTPVVASDLPQVREAVGPGGALLTPAGSPVALAAAIRAVLADPVAARRRTEAARQRFLDRFTVERTASMTVGFYRRCVR